MPQYSYDAEPSTGYVKYNSETEFGKAVNGKDLDEIIRMSRWLMKGRKMRLFYLHISFVPLYLLSILPCGLGFLWTLPYAEESFTCFHLNLTSVAASEQ